MYPDIKAILDKLKKETKFKKEKYNFSEIIAYMYLFYDKHYEDLKQYEHEEILQKVKELLAKQS